MAAPPMAMPHDFDFVTPDADAISRRRYFAPPPPILVGDFGRFFADYAAQSEWLERRDSRITRQRRPTEA